MIKVTAMRFLEYIRQDNVKATNTRVHTCIHEHNTTHTKRKERKKVMY